MNENSTISTTTTDIQNVFYQQQETSSRTTNSVTPNSAKTIPSHQPVNKNPIPISTNPTVLPSPNSLQTKPSSSHANPVVLPQQSFVSTNSSQTTSQSVTYYPSSNPSLLPQQRIAPPMNTTLTPLLPQQQQIPQKQVTLVPQYQIPQQQQQQQMMMQRTMIPTASSPPPPMQPISSNTVPQQQTRYVYVNNNNTTPVPQSSILLYPQQQQQKSMINSSPTTTTTTTTTRTYLVPSTMSTDSIQQLFQQIIPPSPQQRTVITIPQSIQSPTTTTIPSNQQLSSQRSQSMTLPITSSSPVTVMVPKKADALTVLKETILKDKFVNAMNMDPIPLSIIPIPPNTQFSFDSSILLPTQQHSMRLEWSQEELRYIQSSFVEQEKVLFANQDFNRILSNIYSTSKEWSTNESMERDPQQQQRLWYATLDQWIHTLEEREILTSTYYCFSNRRQLFQKLIERYNTRPCVVITSMDQLVKFKREQIDSIRLQLTLLFKNWIKTMFSFEFIVNSEGYQLLQEWISMVEKTNYGMLGSLIKKWLQEATSEYHLKNEPIKFSNCPVSLKPKKSLLKKTKGKIWKYPIQEITRQLCLIEYELFCKIEPKEWCNCAWNKSVRSTQAPNIMYWSNWFTHLSNLVAFRVLKKESMSERLRRLEQCLDLALSLIQENNWNAAMAVIHGLTSKPISRLTNTWNALNEVNKQKFEQLKQLQNKEDNFSVLKHAILQQVSPPTIPYLGIYLSHVQYLEKEFKTLDSKQRIYIPKCRALYRVISEIQYFQSGRKYQFLEVSDLYQAIWNFKPLDEDELFAMSNRLESSFKPSLNFLPPKSNTNNSPTTTSTEPLAEVKNGTSQRLVKAKSLSKIQFKRSNSNTSSNREPISELSTTSTESTTSSSNILLSNNDFIIDKKDIQELLKIGEGAQGVVMKGSYFGTIVAVKYFSKQLAQAESDYFNELNLLAKVSFHTNIVRFFGMTSDSKKLGIVSEYCEGGDLFKLICQVKQGIVSLSMQQKIKILSGVAAGMQYLHHKNIIHRDLKCENILLDSHLNPKIADFGLSKLLKENQDDHAMVGTPAFCAPEILLVKDRSKLVYSSKVDIYSFGIIMYIVWTETVYPYGKLIGVDQLVATFLTNSEFRPVLPDDIPTEWMAYVNLMKQCWHSNPEERPTFATVHSQLANY